MSGLSAGRETQNNDTKHRSVPTVIQLTIALTTSSTPWNHVFQEKYYTVMLRSL